MASCWALHSNVAQLNDDDAPCEDVQQVGHVTTCCVRGSTCMSNGLCQNSGGDGYYSADCTDPTLKDPACQTRCGGLAGSQVLYNSTSNLWACCTYHGGHPDCSNPTDETFPAPSPASLTTIIHLPRTGNVTYPTPSTKATSEPTTDTPSTSASSSSGISQGAAAGIGLGAGFGVILIVTLIALTFFKRRRRTRANLTAEQESFGVSQDRNTLISGPIQQPIMYEMDAKVFRELDTGNVSHEVP